jgi:hypothetical protein
MQREKAPVVSGRDEGPFLDQIEHVGRANGTNSSICHVTETMTLAELDDYETGAQSLWPRIELPR